MDEPAGEQLRQRRRIVHPAQQRRARGYAEGVACRQVGVARQPVAVGPRLAHRLGRLPRLGASLRRRIASTHSPISPGPRKMSPVYPCTSPAPSAIFFATSAPPRLPPTPPPVLHLRPRFRSNPTPAV